METCRQGDLWNLDSIDSSSIVGHVVEKESVIWSYFLVPLENSRFYAHSEMGKCGSQPAGLPPIPCSSDDRNLMGVAVGLDAKFVDYYNTCH